MYCVSWNEWLIIPFLFKFSFETTLPSYNLISKLNILISIKLSDAWDQVNNFSMDRFLSVLADFFVAGTWSLVFGVRVSYVMQIHADHDEAK